MGGGLEAVRVVDDRGVGEAGEAVVPHPDEKSAAAGEAGFGEARSEREVVGLFALGEFDVTGERGVGREMGNGGGQSVPLRPPAGGVLPERVGGRPGRIGTGVAENQLKRAGAGDADFAAEERVVIAPIGGPIGRGREVTAAPGAVDVMVEAAAELGRCGMEARTEGRRGQEAVRRILSGDKGGERGERGVRADERTD